MAAFILRLSFAFAICAERLFLNDDVFHCEKIKYAYRHYCRWTVIWNKVKMMIFHNLKYSHTKLSLEKLVGGAASFGCGNSVFWNVTLDRSVSAADSFGFSLLEASDVCSS